MAHKYEIKLFNTVTSVYRKLKQIDKSIVVLQGGTSSSKTVSILQHLSDIAVQEPGSDITVVGQDMPNLKRGALRDFQHLVKSNKPLAALLENPKALTGPYRFKNGSLIEFVSYDSPQDAQSGKRDYLFVNEAIGINYEIFNTLEVKVKKQTFIDYNPSSKFWVHTEVLPDKEKAYGFISTFADNEYCPDKIRADIKSYFLKWKKTGQDYWANKWRVMGLGLTGIVEGLVFQEWKIIDSFPPKSELDYFGYGIDFGFANDPLAIGMNGVTKQKQLVTKQLLYETGINAYSLNELMPTLGITKDDPIIADSANLDAIDYLASKGWNIVPADKPPGSIKQGIELMKNAGILIVQGSVDFIQEFGSYMYKKRAGLFDKETPIDKDNHGIDQLRYFGRWAILHKGVNPRKVSNAKRKVRSLN